LKTFQRLAVGNQLGVDLQVGSRQLADGNQQPEVMQIED
jgi:hypothetical protein